jgi:hypothetical protein
MQQDRVFRDVVTERKACATGSASANLITHARHWQSQWHTIDKVFSV